MSTSPEGHKGAKIQRKSSKVIKKRPILWVRLAKLQFLSV